MRSRKNVEKYHLRCHYGCCCGLPSKRDERRHIKRQEQREWRRELDKDSLID